ncbi:MAG TPA: hypothetical protein VF832_04315, partial [Longimicrobiales bacterium]
ELLEALAGIQRRGGDLHPGSVVEFGWAPLRIETQGADWVVCEPDFGAEPMRWHPGVDTTLEVLDRQLGLVRLLGLRPTAAHWNQRVLVAPGARQAQEVFFERSSPADEQDTGWYIGVDRPGADPDRRQAHAMTVGELAAAQPAWLTPLTLPVGYFVSFAHGQVRQVMDPQDREVFPA